MKVPFFVRAGLKNTGKTAWLVNHTSSFYKIVDDDGTMAGWLAGEFVGQTASQIPDFSFLRPHPNFKQIAIEFGSGDVAGWFPDCAVKF